MPQDNHPLQASINCRLADVVQESAIVPDWYDDWMLLGPHSTDEERLAVYQSVRDAGSLPDDAAFYLIAWQIDAIASETAETKLRGMDLPDQYHAAWDELFLEKLEEHGELEMADLFRADREEFDRRSEVGRQWFHGSDADGEEDEPPWLQDLLELVAASIHADTAPGALGCCYRDDDGQWEVLTFLRPVEIVGGASDGEVLQPAFSLDTEFLRSGFERVTSSGWNMLGPDDPDGPSVWIEGLYQDHQVLLRVQACAPDDVEPVKHFNNRPDL